MVEVVDVALGQEVGQVLLFFDFLVFFFVVLLVVNGKRLGVPSVITGCVGNVRCGPTLNHGVGFLHTHIVTLMGKGYDAVPEYLGLWSSFRSVYHSSWQLLQSCVLVVVRVPL